MIRLYHKTVRSLRHGMARAYEALAHVGGLIVWPVERAFAATFGKAFHMLEGFERVEDWLLGLFWLITWPIRMVWRLVAGLGRLVLPAAVREAIGKRLAGVDHFLHGAGAAAWRLVEWLNLDGLMRWLAWALQPVWRPIAGLLGFGYTWFATRPYKQMLWGLPVLVLLLPIGGAVAWGLTWGRGSVETHYKLAAKEAREAEDIERMQFFERKLAQLEVETQGTDYKAALGARGGRQARRGVPAHAAACAGNEPWLSAGASLDRDPSAQRPTRIDGRGAAARGGDPSRATRKARRRRR